MHLRNIKSQKISTHISRIAMSIFCAVVAFILALMVFYFPNVDFILKKPYAEFNII